MKDMRALIQIVENHGGILVETPDPTYQRERANLANEIQRLKDSESYLNLYRVMGVRDDWLGDLSPGDNLGLHWSLASDMHVHEMRYDREKTILVTALVPTSAIDVEKSVGYQMTYPEEAEMALEAGTHVTLVSIDSLDETKRSGLAYAKNGKLRKDLYGKSFIANVS